MGKLRIIVCEAEGAEEVAAAFSLLARELGATESPAPPAAPPEIPRALEAPAPAPAHKKPGPKPKAPIPENAAPDPAPGGEGDFGIAKLCIQALRNGPLSSSEVHKKIGKGRPIGSVYDALHRLRDQGVVESVVDEKDGQRKNMLKAAAK